MLVDLSTHYMQILASCIERNDFSALFQILPRSRQKQTTPADLAAHFQDLVQSGVNLATAKNLTPVFNPAPYIDEQGILLLKGSYPSQPPVDFNFFCIREGSAWTLEGFALNLR